MSLGSGNRVVRDKTKLCRFLVGHREWSNEGAQETYYGGCRVFQNEMKAQQLLEGRLMEKGECDEEKDVMRVTTVRGSI